MTSQTSSHDPHGASPADDIKLEGAALLAECRRRLVQSLDAVNASPALIAIGQEAVHLAPDLPPPEQATLLLLTTTLLVSLQQGDTRVRRGEMLGRKLAALWTGELEPAMETITDWNRRLDQLLSHDAAADLFGTAGEPTPFIVDRDCLYLHRMWNAESRCAARLRERLMRDVSFDAADESLLDEVTTAPILLSDEQRAAVRQASSSPFAVITGGPGTGKTTIVVALLRLLLRMGMDPTSIAMVAPTGKAANRLAESLAAQRARLETTGLEKHGLKTSSLEEGGLELLPAPRTLHRLLKFSPQAGQFRHHELNPLPEQVILVDEASMVDVVMMDRLVAALGPQARLILIGDADQLPSVESGAVFRDLSVWQEDKQADHPLRRRVARLTASRRIEETTGGEARSPQNVLRVARILNTDPARCRDLWIRDPEAATTESILIREDARELDFRGAEQLAVSSEGDLGSPASQARHYDRLIELFLERWFEQFLVGLTEAESAEPTDRSPLTADRGGRLLEADAERAERIFRTLQAARLLCVTRRRRGGVERTNRYLHRLFAEQTGRSPLQEFLVGEPVMVLENDYQRQLFNGDQGIILPVRQAEMTGLADGTPLAEEEAIAGPTRLMAVFARAGSFYAHSVRSLRGKIELSFAMTVHKSQGSEFDHVGLILPGEMVPLLTREVIYTALTRSKQSATLFGSTRLVEEGALRTIQRECGIAERILETE